MSGGTSELVLSNEAIKSSVCDKGLHHRAEVVSLSTRTNENPTRQVESQTTVAVKGWRSGMYDGDEEDDYVTQSDGEPEATLIEDEPSFTDVENLNPWTIARVSWSKCRESQPSQQ